MLKQLKFVMGAVAKKDLLPAMTHFRIENGTVRSYNGTLALSSPVDLDVDCIPKADSLVKAISNCKETIALNLTAGGRLSIKSGGFRAYVECVEGDTPHVEPEGEIVNFDGEALLQAIKVVSQFVGNDASRPWTNGMLLRDQSAFATNNVCVIQYWIGMQMPFTVNIPRAALMEMVRIDEAPTYAQITQNSMTFHYTDGRWIRTQLLTTGWANLDQILDKPSNPKPINPRLFEGIEILKGMTDNAGRLYIKDGMLRTHTEEYIGGSFEIPELEFDGCYNISMLGLLNGVVTHADFSLYPGPCLFFGPRLRGAIIGLRM